MKEIEIEKKIDLEIDIERKRGKEILKEIENIKVTEEAALVNEEAREKEIIVREVIVKERPKIN